MIYKGLMINEEEKMCYINSSPIMLSKKEYELLKYLLSIPNHIFSREHLLVTIWDSNQVSTRTVDTTISRLRKKLEEYGSNIITRSGFGYGFTTR